MVFWLNKNWGLSLIWKQCERAQPKQQPLPPAAPWLLGSKRFVKLKISDEFPRSVTTLRWRWSF
ncbi:50S ribosomal protein L28 [Candidatus Hodgkinia cicadicola]|nr:50S ribosomal protein L28 [Candidatus Hodgkinia cicadicola]